MSLPEELTSALTSKVERINILQKVVMQERINLKSKRLGSDEQVEQLNEQVRAFLFGLLEEELGLAAASPEVAPGLQLSSEKTEALNILLERMVTKREAPSAQPVVAPRRPASSPILDAIKAQLGGNEAWLKLTPAQRAAEIKKMEANSQIDYTPVTTNREK